MMNIQPVALLSLTLQCGTEGGDEKARKKWLCLVFLSALG